MLDEKNEIEIKSANENFRLKKILSEKKEELMYINQHNENLMDKLTNLVTELVNRKKGFSFFILETEELNNKKKLLESETYVIV